MLTPGLPATEQEQARFFAQLCDGFQAASARTGEIVRDFRIAGTLVRLRFAGDALVPSIVPGLAYPVDRAPAAPGCEICLWDSESTGVPPPPARRWEDFTGRGNIWGFGSLRYRSAYQWGEGSVNVMDRETGRAVFWVPSHQHLPAWVLAAPLRSILHWWMELNGRQLVHAAAVGSGGRAVLIPGRGGSGKSSTSIACLLAGMEFVSDDYLALALDPEPTVYRLYSTAKLDPRNLARYPELAARCRAVHQPGFDKVVLFLEDGFGRQLRESLPLKLVLRPYIAGMPDTTLAPVEPREIERALAAETLVHLPHAGVHTVTFLERVSHEVPRAAIHLGTDRTGIAAAIQHALRNGVPHEAKLVDPARRAEVPIPFLSVLIHFREQDHAELAAVAADLEAQGYPRVELVVTAEGPARGLAQDAARLPGMVRFLPYDDPVVNAEAWNRGIREAFGELLILIEPGDRLAPGALDALIAACAADAAAAWVRGRISGVDDDISPLRGALIRKNAFRECGLFQTDPLLQGREQRDWLQRVEQSGRGGCQIETVTLLAARASAIPPAAARKVDLSLLREQLRQRRQKTPE